MSGREYHLRPRVGPQEVLYENQYQQVYKVRLDFEDFAKEIFVTHYGDRVGVVVEGSDGILLTRQYRYLIDRISWEIPGGKVDPGEDSEAAELRECLEESGIVCLELRPLLAYQVGLDTVCNPTQLYYAQRFKDCGFTEGPHDNEVCGRAWVPLHECISMISGGAIVDGFSIIALLSYKTFIKRY